MPARRWALASPRANYTLVARGLACSKHLTRGPTSRSRCNGFGASVPLERCLALCDKDSVPSGCPTPLAEPCAGISWNSGHCHLDSAHNCDPLVKAASAVLYWRRAARRIVGSRISEQLSSHRTADEARFPDCGAEIVTPPASSIGPRVVPSFSSPVVFRKRIPVWVYWEGRRPPTMRLALDTWRRFLPTGQFELRVLDRATVAKYLPMGRIPCANAWNPALRSDAVRRYRMCAHSRPLLFLTVCVRPAMWTWNGRCAFYYFTLTAGCSSMAQSS